MIEKINREIVFYSNQVLQNKRIDIEKNKITDRMRIIILFCHILT